MLKILICHLFNDSSGSPVVLRSVVNLLRREEYAVGIYVGSHGNGVLDDCGVPLSKYFYRRFDVKILTLISYFISQAALFFRLLWDHRKNAGAVVYVNTLMPFGAALYGLVVGKPVVYHVHEIDVGSAALRAFLLRIVRLCAGKVIYVSGVHQDLLPIPGVPASVVYNPVDEKYAAAQARTGFIDPNAFQVLMLASLRAYKGVDEYLALARSYEGDAVKFTLVLNEPHETVERFRSDGQLPSNLMVHSRTNDVRSFYARADLVVNLSRVDLVTETFGLTLVEAMAMGLPVIAPPVGGPAEIVSNGVDGYLVDSRNLGELRSVIDGLRSDLKKYIDFSEQAFGKAKLFSFSFFKTKIVEILGSI